MILGYLPILLLLWDWRIAEACQHKTFELYDGYELTAPNFAETIGHQLHFAVSSLQECIGRCASSGQCTGVNYNGNTCRELDSHFSRQATLTRSANSTSNFNIYANKICLNDSSRRCQHRQWAFENVLGYHLVYPSAGFDRFATERLGGIGSKLDCAQRCLDERRFTCRSALFDSDSGECILAEMDRYTVDTTYSDRIEPLATRNLRPKFVQANSDTIHYIENKCIEEPAKFCDFRRLNGYKLKTVDAAIRGVDSSGECREICLSNRPTPCKSFEFDPFTSTCRISHLNELSSIHIVEPYRMEEHVTTQEISTCYNVSITCEPRAMKVEIETSKLFNGKIYAKSQPKQCANDVKNRLQFGITLPYIDKTIGFAGSQQPQQQQCDTRQDSLGNFANDIVIQHHDLVLTTKDLSLGVHCKFDLQNDSVTRIDLKVQGDILTDKLKSTAKLPELSLHIVDYQGRDIEEVLIGDLLRVQVRMSDEGTYGIFLRNLIAKDSFNRTNNFTLIDGKGCPVHMKMMREVRTVEGEGKSLESYLEAFTFTGGSLLVIEAEVETCLDKCKPVQCQVANGRSDDDLETVISYGRRRRRRRRAIVTDIEQAEKGDVLSMTMLSKSLLIRPRNQTPWTNDSIQPSPHSSGSLIDQNRKASFAASTHSSLDQTKRHKSPPDTWQSKAKSQSIIVTKEQRSLLERPSAAAAAFPYLRLAISNKRYVCFEPMNLFIICLLSFCIQGFLFSLLFYVIIRRQLINCNTKKQLRNSASTLPLTSCHNTPVSGYRVGTGANPYNFMR